MYICYISTLLYSYENKIHCHCHWQAPPSDKWFSNFYLNHATINAICNPRGLSPSKSGRVFLFVLKLSITRRALSIVGNTLNLNIAVYIQANRDGCFGCCENYQLHREHCQLLGIPMIEINVCLYHAFIISTSIAITIDILKKILSCI